MDPNLLFAFLAGIVILGFLGQWFAWWMQLPSIVFLFAFGLLAGPFTGVLTPDQMFGDLLFPTVSALIGVILFEGGLTLRFDELKNRHAPVLRVLFLGGCVTFLLTTLFAYVLLGFSFSLSFLLGAILVVTGPTVVIPLLQQIKPKGAAGSIARWEGIIIDPLGAILAVVVLGIIVAGPTVSAAGIGAGALEFFEAILIGSVVGLLFAYVITLLFDWYWIPDYLHTLAMLAFVLGAQAISSYFAHEAGLLAVTLMGMYMANQERVAVRRLLHFKEELRILFISLLFVILVARLEPSFFYDVGVYEGMFLGALILLIRPLAILCSTAGTELSWSERGFLAWIAPRGIVAAAVASLFSEKLRTLPEFDVQQAAKLEEVTFLVIAGTVLVYGFTLKPLSQFLGVSEPDPQGVLIIGAHEWARALGRALSEAGVLVRFVDKNPEHVRRVEQEGMQVQRIDVLTESEFKTTNMQGIGYVLALTPNDEVNTLTMVHAGDMGFDQSKVFQIPIYAQDDGVEKRPDPFQGRLLFQEGQDYNAIREKYASGWEVNMIEIEDQQQADRIEEHIPASVLPVAKVEEDGTVIVRSEDEDRELEAGDRIVGLMAPSISTGRV